MVRIYMTASPISRRPYFWDDISYPRQPNQLFHTRESIIIDNQKDLNLLDKKNTINKETIVDLTVDHTDKVTTSFYIEDTIKVNNSYDGGIYFIYPRILCQFISTIMKIFTNYKVKYS